MDEAERRSYTTLSRATEELKNLKRLLSRTLVVLGRSNRGKVFEAQTGRRELRRLGEELQRITTAETVARAEQALGHAVNEAKLRYREDLERALHSDSVRFSGEWPSYVLNDVLPLRVDLAGDVVLIGRKRLQSLDIERVLPLIRKELENLLSRPFDAAEFSALVARACEEVAKSLEVAYGDYVPIKPVFQKIRLNRGPQYSIEHFAVDLHRLVEAVAAEKVPIELDLSPARSPATGILVPGPNRSHVSGIRVRHRGGEARERPARNGTHSRDGQANC